MVQIQAYGLLIGAGILAGMETAERARLFLTREHKRYRHFSVWGGVWWVVLPALVGARLYHVIDFWEYYAQFPQKIIATWEGGMGIWGGIIGGIFGLVGYAIILDQKHKRSKISNSKFLIPNLLAMADLAVIGLPLGQAIGRLGNFFNQELYGLPTELPWGLYIKPENRLGGYDKENFFHPLFAYEAIWNLGIFLLLWRLVKKKKLVKSPGRLFFVYISLYGLGRFWLEFLRIDPWRWGSLTVAQWLSLIAIGAALFYSTRIWILKSKP